MSGPVTTGTVTFKDGATILGTDTLDGAGQATFTTSDLDVGTHTITATYGGSTGFGVSVSTPPITHTVMSSGVFVFPSAATTGTPPGWTPTTTQSGDLVITTPGAVVDGYRINNGNIRVNASNVTVRNCEVNNGSIWNFGGGAGMNHGMVIEDCSILSDPGFEPASMSAVIGPGSFTATGVLIDGPGEGVRIGELANGALPSTMTFCYIHCHGPEGAVDWHGDGLQGYLGNDITINNCVIWLEPGGAGIGTAPWFYNDSGTQTIDGLICIGGGYSFRTERPGSVNRLYVVEGSYAFGPRLVTSCGSITAFDGHLCTLDGDGQPIVGASFTCS